MKQVSQVYEELRERHLLWLGGLLIAATIIIPVALLKGAASSPVPRAPILSASLPGAAALPVVTARQTVDSTNLLGAPHDPFNQGAGHASKAIPAASTGGHGPSPSHTVRAALSARAGGGSGASGSGGSSGGGTSSSTSTSTRTVTVTTTVTGTSTPDGFPKPVELSADQAYSPTIALTRGSGLDTLDGVERLTPLPNSTTPLLLPLGTLQGGQRELFAVLPGTVVSGPGRCVPGTADCELIVLAPDQIERASKGLTSFNFALTAVHVANYRSAAAAQAARRSVSRSGLALLHGADLPATSFFPFNAGLGALVDLRNLTSSGAN